MAGVVSTFCRCIGALAMAWCHLVDGAIFVFLWSFSRVCFLVSFFYGYIACMVSYCSIVSQSSLECLVVFLTHGNYNIFFNFNFYRLKVNKFLIYYFRCWVVGFAAFGWWSVDALGLFSDFGFILLILLQWSNWVFYLFSSV